MESDDKKEKRFKATTPAKRFMKLAGMSASIAKNYTAHKVKGLFSDQDARQKSQEKLLLFLSYQQLLAAHFSEPLDSD